MKCTSLGRGLLLVLLASTLLCISGCATKTTDAAGDLDGPGATGTRSDADTDTDTEDSTGDGLFSLSDTARSVLANVDARKAIALAINKKALVDQALNNGSIPVDYMVVPGIAVSEKGEDYRNAAPSGWVHYNLDSAKLLWAKAQREIGFSKVVIPLLTMESEQAMAVGKGLKKQLEASLPGLTLEVYGYSLNEKTAKSTQGVFGLEYFGWGPDYPDPLTYLDLFSQGNPNNTGGYNNPTYNKIIDTVKTSPAIIDSNVRYRQLLEGERLLLDKDVAVIPLYQSGTSYLTASYVTGIEQHSFGMRYSYKYADTRFDSAGNKKLRIVGTSDIDSIDPNKAFDTTSFEVMANVMEGLVRLGQKDIVEPGVAESWEISRDGKTYTFHIRENAKWSNGLNVTADDFVFAWRRLADPATKSAYSFILKTARIKNCDQVVVGELPPSALGVSALDPKTLTVTLETPVPYFLKLMGFASFYPINRAFFEAQKDDPFGTTKETALYNGPFVLGQWDPSFGYTYVKNNYYWDVDAVKLDQVTVRILRNVDQGVKLYEEQSLDRCEVRSQLKSKYENYPNFSTQLDSSVFYLVFNMKTNLHK